MKITAGVAVEVRTAFDEWVPAIAMSGIEGTHGMRAGKYRKIHDFPVVMVATSQDGVAVGWPAEDVRLPEAADDERLSA